MPRTKSSRRWLKEHFSDAYVKKAKRFGVRSRAYYKLEELDARDKLFKPGMTVIDLGSSPGGWAEYVVKKVGKKGCVIALDILPMPAIEGVTFIQGDFSDETVFHHLMKEVGETKIDWVISDMAPNVSGIESVDQPRSIALVELALALALHILSSDGGFLAKVFQGEGFDQLLLEVRKNFKKVAIRKPDASRGRSKEVYILARK